MRHRELISERVHVIGGADDVPGRDGRPGGGPDGSVRALVASGRCVAASSAPFAGGQPVGEAVWEHALFDVGVDDCRWGAGERNEVEHVVRSGTAKHDPVSLGAHPGRPPTANLPQTFRPAVIKRRRQRVRHDWRGRGVAVPGGQTDGRLGIRNRPKPCTRSTYTTSTSPQPTGPNGPSQPSGIQHMNRRGQVTDICGFSLVEYKAAP